MATVDFPQNTNSEKSTTTNRIICDPLEELVKLNNLHQDEDNDDEEFDEVATCTPSTTTTGCISGTEDEHHPTAAPFSYEQVPQLASSSSLLSCSTSSTLMLFDQLNQNDLFTASSFSLENFIKKHDTISTYLEKINLDEDDYDTTLR